MVIAITGMMGAGKSYICKSLKEKGFSVISVDDYVTRLYQDKLFVAKIILKFGTYVKSEIRDRVMSNPDDMRWLENVSSKKIKKMLYADMDTYESIPNGILFVEFPLLFELGDLSKFDKIVTVYCSSDIQMERLLNDPKRTLDKEKIKFFNDKQIDIEYKKEHSDVNIDTSTQQTKEEGLTKVIRMILDYLEDNAK